MRSIQKGVVMPIGNELPSIRELGAELRLKTQGSGWLRPLFYTVKLVFFVLLVFPPALLFWFSFIAAGGDVNYLLAELSKLMQNTSATALATAATSAYCVVALFEVLLVALYVFLFPYRKASTSYIVAKARDAAGKEHALRVPAHRTSR